jgi:uncharacterized membrane protein YccC
VRLRGKHAFVALANLSDAFSRMMQEPRRQQKKIGEMHQFVVASQMLTSYIATLAYYEKPLAAKHANPAYQPVVATIVRSLERAAAILQEGGAVGEWGGLLKKEQSAMVKPVEDQFGFIGKVAGDILKLSPVLHEALT